MSHRISPRTFLPFHFLRSARSVLDNGNPIEYSVSKPASANLISPVSNSSLRNLALLSLSHISVKC